MKKFLNMNLVYENKLLCRIGKMYGKISRKYKKKKLQIKDLEDSLGELL